MISIWAEDKALAARSAPFLMDAMVGLIFAIDLIAGDALSVWAQGTFSYKFA
jgi:hypothetical protein